MHVFHIQDQGKASLKRLKAIIVAAIMSLRPNPTKLVSSAQERQVVICKGTDLCRAVAGIAATLSSIMLSTCGPMSMKTW